MPPRDRGGRWSGAALAAALMTACGDGAGPGNAVGFVEPLAGARNQRFFYLNYVDRLPGPGIRDYNCGLKTYDGHTGTDITLANFAVMDSGVPVLAAAPGRVVHTHDGEFDRQTRWIAGAVSNFVRIRHADGVESSYLHLKRNSVAVTVGEDVDAGDLLGQVGSSGFSDIPHLHIELRAANGGLIDPWSGACGESQSRWAAQLPYQDAFSLHASGLSTSQLSLDEVKGPPPHVATFSTADSQVAMWVQLLNVPAGAQGEFRIYQPDGELFGYYPFTQQRFYGLSWWWIWHAIPGYLTPGTWRMQFRHNGDVLAEHAFVVEGISVGPMRPSVRAGLGGGFAGADRAWWPEQSSKLSGALAEPR
jgi:murein DD-endopeptidase MepM/ murein hydrolase activator NlpD